MADETTVEVSVPKGANVSVPITAVIAIVGILFGAGAGGGLGTLMGTGDSDKIAELDTRVLLLEQRVSEHESEMKKDLESLSEDLGGITELLDRAFPRVPVGRPAP